MGILRGKGSGALLGGLVAVGALAVGAAPAGAAATLLVPSQYPTIQAAIGASADGDTVLVAPGTYFGRVDFQQKDITVASEAGADVTTIDGQGLRSAVTMHADPGESPTLRGFTITNGRAVFEDGYSGGGVKTSGGPAVIEDNVVTGNTSCSGGSGIEASSSQAIIRGNTIVGNRQAGCSGGPGGGGVLIIGGGLVELLDNVIRSNTQGVGGGVSLFSAGTPTIARNVIAGNSSFDEGGGIWIVNESDAQIESNLIYGNATSAGGRGGGIYWGVPSGDRGPFLVNNTIADNTAASGAAVYADGFDGGARFANNVLIGTGSGAVLYCDPLRDPADPPIEFNDVVNLGAGPRYGGSCLDRTGQDGNVSVAPMFVDAGTGDYHLSAASPLVDAGTNVGVPALDIDGQARTSDGDGNGVPVTDIGADEAAPGADTTPPTLQLPSGLVVDATTPQGAVVTYSVTATDNADPNPDVSCLPASGSTFAIGQTSVACTATDDSGNSSTGSFGVTVRSAAQQIAALRAEVVLLPDEKVGKSLDTKLRDAASALAAGQKSKACSKLADFIAEVQRHRGGKIPTATADEWIADASRIRAVIGC